MAVAVMQLVERGIISMDDDVRAIIPELRDMTVFENTDLVLVDSTTYIALGASDLMITGGSVSSSPAYTKLLPILKFHEKGMDVILTSKNSPLMIRSSGFVYNSSSTLLQE
jgi:hypothetical protein